MQRIITIAALVIAVAVPAAAFADELTKSVQTDLVALGYEPGNTDGEATTQTVIAISQFQAENNLEVTGEASPQLAGVIQAKLDAKNNPGGAMASAPAVAATQQSGPRPMDEAALREAQQACLQEKIATAQASQKKKRGFGSLIRAATNTAARFGGNSELARQVQKTSYDIYRVDATAEDWARAAEDLGLTNDDLEACRSPAMSSGATGTQIQTAGTQSPTPGMPVGVGMGMGMGMETIPAPPDNNVKLPDSYSFSYRASISIKNSKGTAEPVFYLQPDAPYYAQKQTNSGLTEFLVLDNQNNMAVIFGEFEGRKSRMHNYINVQTKATLIGAYRDARETEPVKAIESKTILGYHSKGYQISTEAGTTRLWITDEAPASLFSSMFAHRTDVPGLPFSKHSMIMEVSFTSADTPEKNYQMECTGLQPETLVLNKSDYQEAL